MNDPARESTPIATEHGADAELKIAEALRLMSRTGWVLAKCCRAFNLDPVDFYRMARHDEGLREAHRVAYELGTQALEQAMIERGTKGVAKGVYYLGTRVATEYHPSDAMLTLALKARRPKVYRETVRIEQRPVSEVALDGGAQGDLLPEMMDMYGAEAFHGITIDGTAEPAGPDDTGSSTPAAADEDHDAGPAGGPAQGK